MKIRKFSLGHRCTVTFLFLLFGVFAPIGCAQTPKNLFSKVWGPDRISFKEAVGMGDSRNKKNSKNFLADKFGSKSAAKQFSKPADNGSKSIGQKIGDFGKVLMTGFDRSDKKDASLKKTSKATPPTRTRIEEARKRLASNNKSISINKPNGDPGLRNLGKTSASETLRKNRIRNDLKTKKSPTGSLYASRSAEGRNSLDNSRTNPFAEFLDTQNPSQSRRSVPSANNKTQGNTLARSDNPFADVRNQSNQIPVKEPVKKSTGSPSSNQFVAEFDNSWDKIRREQEQFDDDDDSDELDELDEIDSTRKARNLVSASVEKTGPKETGINQDTNLSRREKSREHVDNLMLSAHSELAKGRTVDALNYARHAEEIASNEGVFFGPKEEHPGDLVQSIHDRMENIISQAGIFPPANLVIIPRNRGNAIQETGNSSQRTENTNPFAEFNPSEKRYAALPQPPNNTASVGKFNSLRVIEKTNDQAFEPRTAEASPPSYAELQTVIVEVSDPFDGMIVESDSVPARIPAQGVQKKTDFRPIIRSADAQANEYRGPKTIPQKVLNRLKSSTPPPAEFDRNHAPQKQRSRSQSRDNSNRSRSQEKKPKRVHSNQGARIITTRHQVPFELDNVWHPVETKERNQVETADLTVVNAEHTEEPVKVASAQPVIATRERFFQMGGSSDEQAPAATGLADWGGQTGYKAGSRISEMRERFLIIVGIVIAGLIGFGIRRRYSLRLLWQKFASR